MSPTSIAEPVPEEAPPAHRPAPGGRCRGGRAGTGSAAGARGAGKGPTGRDPRGAGPGRAVPGGGGAGRGDAPGPGGSGGGGSEQQQPQTLPPSFSLSDFKGQPKAPGLPARRSRRSGSPQPAPAALIAEGGWGGGECGVCMKGGGRNSHLSARDAPTPVNPSPPPAPARGRQPVSCGEAGGGRTSGGSPHACVPAAARPAQAAPVPPLRGEMLRCPPLHRYLLPPPPHLPPTSPPQHTPHRRGGARWPKHSRYLREHPGRILALGEQGRGLPRCRGLMALSTEKETKLP